MEVESSKQLVNDVKIYRKPTYRLNKLLPQAGSQNVTITNAGGNETLIEVPIVDHNWARSHLSMVVTPVASGANAYNLFYGNVISPIRQLKLSTRGGLDLCLLNYANNYTNITMAPETKLSEFLTYQSSTFNNTEGGSFGAVVNGGNVPTNFFGPSSGAYFYRYDGVADGKDSNSIADNIYNEPHYFITSDVTTDTKNQPSPVLKCKIPFALFKETIFSLDKDIYANEVLVLTITWEQSQKIITITTQADDGSNNKTPAVAPSAYTADIKVSELALFLATNRDESVKNSLMQKVYEPSGLTMLVPFVKSWKTGLGPSSTQSLSQRLSKGDGIVLRKFYSAVYNNTESKNTAYDHDCRTSVLVNASMALGKKVQTFYDQLNDQRLTDYDYNVSKYDDWFALREKLRGSAIQTADMFYYNWFWLQDFSGMDKGDTKVDSQNLLSGVSLEKEQKYDLYYTALNTTANETSNGGTYQHYQFAITTKLLTVTSTGITFA